MPRLTRDAQGTPGILAQNPGEAYAGIGWLHGRHRPLQALLLGAAGRARLAELLAPLAPLVALDALSWRLDLPARGAQAAAELDNETAAMLDAYLVGFANGLAAAGRPPELRYLLTDLPPLDRGAIVSGLLLSSFLGLAEGQERMERLLVDALAAGAKVAALEEMFAPHLDGWEPERLARLPRQVEPGFAACGMVGAGGSNAWAVVGERAAGGKPILCGDPHLQINQLPSVFFELRARVGDDFWLGATIPGLPALAVGRNRQLAWSGTFACADNVDLVIERLAGGRLLGGDRSRVLVERQAVLRRRGLPARRLRFRLTEHGAIDSRREEGDVLAAQWAAAGTAAATLGAYLRLPRAQSAAEAERLLAGVGSYSLHWVLADQSGDVRYCQAGTIPRRGGGWSGLYPAAAGEARWRGFYDASELPRQGAVAGVLVSANEARSASDGRSLATLAQPDYRARRIAELLGARTDHDRRSMRDVQADLLSLQGVRLTPRFVAGLPPGPLREALAVWDHRCDAESRGAHAFALAYAAARAALASELGGEWFVHQLACTELGVWWLAAIDRLLAAPGSWTGARGAALRAALVALGRQQPHAWGEVQRFALPHVVLGGFGRLFGWGRPERPLPGSPATVCQGNLVPGAQGTVAVGPAYRMIADLSTDELWTSLPGGVDGRANEPSYACWLDEWARVAHHRLTPPANTESAINQ